MPIIAQWAKTVDSLSGLRASIPKAYNHIVNGTTVALHQHSFRGRQFYLQNRFVPSGGPKAMLTHQQSAGADWTSPLTGSYFCPKTSRGGVRIPEALAKAAFGPFGPLRGK